jgi:hypothetical protein
LGDVGRAVGFHITRAGVPGWQMWMSEERGTTSRNSTAVEISDGGWSPVPAPALAPSHQLTTAGWATELEMAEATVLDLKPTEWRDLALA